METRQSQKDKKLEMITNLDLALIKFKIQQSKRNGGLGWSAKKTDQAEVWYKNFLVLLHLYPNKDIVPTVDIDEFWHYHILDTRKYYEDCMAIFGNIVHHYPYLGLFGKKDEQKLQSKFNATRKLYQKTFSEELVFSGDIRNMKVGAYCGGNTGSNCAARCQSAPKPVYCGGNTGSNCAGRCNRKS